MCDFIYEARSIKPIYAFANDAAYSAAYAIASSASKIFLSRTAVVGSIGVLANHLDTSKFDEMVGLKYTTVFAGDRKNDMSPHEPLSDAASADLQKEVDRLYGMFVSLIARNRSLTEDKIRDTKAGLFFGSEAIEAGLADQIFAYSNNNRRRKMTEEHDYRSEFQEIAQLCKLAKSDKLNEFIEQGLSVDQVKEALLALKLRRKPSPELSMITCK